MFRSVIKTALAAVAFAALASAANAAVLSFELSQEGFSNLVLNPGTSFANFNFITFGTFNINQLQATTTPVIDGGAPPGLLNSTAINIDSAITAGTQTLHIFVTAQNVTAFLEPQQDDEQQHSTPTFSSGFTWVGGDGTISITEQTFIDPANGQFTTPHQLGSATFTTNGENGTQTTTQNTTFGPLSAPYSLTEEYTITMGPNQGAGGPFIALSAAVPEPSTWAMMLLGFAGLGFAFRQSRRRVSFA